MIPQPGFGCIITLQSKAPPIDCVYQLTINSYLDCMCPAFKEMMSKFGRRGVLFKYCKHLYYIFVKVCALDPELNLFIHAPTFSFNEIKLVLESGILTLQLRRPLGEHCLSVLIVWYSQSFLDFLSTCNQEALSIKCLAILIFHIESSNYKLWPIQVSSHPRFYYNHHKLPTPPLISSFGMLAF